MHPPPPTHRMSCTVSPNNHPQAQTSHMPRSRHSTALCLILSHLVNSWGGSWRTGCLGCQRCVCGVGTPPSCAYPLLFLFCCSFYTCSLCAYAHIHTQKQDTHTYIHIHHTYKNIHKNTPTLPSTGFHISIPPGCGGCESARNTQCSAATPSPTAASGGGGWGCSHCEAHAAGNACQGATTVFG